MYHTIQYTNHPLSSIPSHHHHAIPPITPHYHWRRGQVSLVDIPRHPGLSLSLDDEDGGATPGTPRMRAEQSQCRNVSSIPSVILHTGHSILPCKTRLFWMATHHSQACPPNYFAGVESVGQQATAEHALESSVDSPLSEFPG